MLTSQAVQVVVPWLTDEKSYAAAGGQTLLHKTHHLPQAGVPTLRVLEERLISCDRHDCQHCWELQQ